MKKKISKNYKNLIKIIFYIIINLIINFFSNLFNKNLSEARLLYSN